MRSAAIGLVFVGIACSPNKPENITLARPQWACPQPPTAEKEGGTCAYPDDDYIHLRWIIGDEPDLEGYYINRRRSTDFIDTLYATVVLTREQLSRRGEVMEWIDRGSSPGTLFYYVLFSFDRDGHRSARSDTVAYQLLDKPYLDEPGPKDTLRDGRPTFRFGPNRTDVNISSYVLRVVTDSTSSQVVWVSPQSGMQGGYTAGEKTTVQYGTGGLIKRPTLAPGKYRWRVDFQGISSTKLYAPCGCVYDPVRCPGSDSSLPSPSELSFVGSQSGWRQFIIAP